MSSFLGIVFFIRIIMQFSGFHLETAMCAKDIILRGSTTKKTLLIWGNLCSEHQLPKGLVTFQMSFSQIPCVWTDGNVLAG